MDSQGWSLWRTPCYIYHDFQWQPLQTENTYAVNVKTWWENRKNKNGYLNIFKQLFVYNHIKLTAMRTFFQDSIYFFLLYTIILKWRRLFCSIMTLHFTIFSWHYYRHEGKVDVIFFCYILEVLTDSYKFYKFHSYKFYNDKWKNDY